MILRKIAGHRPWQSQSQVYKRGVVADWIIAKGAAGPGDPVKET